jgi:hypothetical protein
VRDITRMREDHDIRFTVDIRTSLGIVKVKGWRWLRGVNRIVNPTCNGHHLMVVPLHIRSIIRKLLTKGVRAKYQFDIPSVKETIRVDIDNMRGLISTFNGSEREDV